MPDTGLLFFSVLCLVMGGAMILSPHALAKLNAALNQTFCLLDQRLMRFRHVIGAGLFIASYLFFKLALLLPGLRG